MEKHLPPHVDTCLPGRWPVLRQADSGDDHLQGLYFECIDKASEIEDVEDQKKDAGYGGGGTFKIATGSKILHYS